MREELFGFVDDYTERFACFKFTFVEGSKQLPDAEKMNGACFGRNISDMLTQQTIDHRRSLNSKNDFKNYFKKKSIKKTENDLPLRVRNGG